MSPGPALLVNLHGIWLCGGFLGVRCLACDHRAVLDKETLPIIRRANMTPLRALKLRCQGCGVSGAGKEFWEMHGLFDREQAERFQRGYDVGWKATLY